ncbi:MAG: Mrp/NBP35 family ATP-binding protein [Actinomycetes bacterium]
MTLLPRRAERGSLDLDAVHGALGEVLDPELFQPVTTLGMVAGVQASGGRVVVELRLTVASCPLRDELTARVRTAVGRVPGVRDVEVRLTSMSDPQRRVLAEALRGRRPEGVSPFGALGSTTAVVAVASGKGGVGKSSVTANLAAALAASGRAVGLLDADVWGYSIPGLFGVRRAPVSLPGLMLPVPAHGVRLMSTGFFVAEDAPVVWRGPMLHKALAQFLSDVHWGELDVLLVDLPPGTGDVTISLLELAPSAGLVVVTTPQAAARTVASRVGRMAADQKVPVLGVVENMSGLVCSGCGEVTTLFGEGGGTLLAQALGVPLLARIPLDPALRQAGDDGTPVVLSDPTSPAAQALRELAGALPLSRPSIVGRPLPLSVV